MKKQVHLRPGDLADSDKLGLTYNLGQAHKKMLLRQSGIMKKFGLTARQSLIIAYLSTHKKEVVTQKTLEDHLHLTNPTITVMVKSMIEKGLIRKERVPDDARKYRLYMTEKAKQVEQASREASIDLDQSFYEGVSESDMRVFKSVLQQIMKNLDTQSD
jgi:DNA-binding MarR family transcriptional regulator